MLDILSYGITNAYGINCYFENPEVRALKGVVVHLNDVVNKQQETLLKLEKRLTDLPRMQSAHNTRNQILPELIWEKILLHTAHRQDWVAVSKTCRGALVAAQNPKLRQRTVDARLFVHADSLLLAAQIACTKLEKDREGFLRNMQSYYEFVEGALWLCKDLTGFDLHSKALKSLTVLIKA